MISPDRAGYGPSWYAVIAGAAPDCRVLASDLDVDACVIGGGIAGLTIARELARYGWSAAVIEAQRIGEGGLERGAGVVAPGFSASPERLAERAGIERARMLWELSRTAVAYVRRTIADHDISAADPVDGCLLAESGSTEHAVRRRLELLHALGETDAEFWPAERVRGALHSRDHRPAVYLPAGFHLDPHRYALGLAAAASEAGVRVYEHTQPLTIDVAGVRKRVVAQQGLVRARHIVLAGSTDAGRLDPPLAATTMTLACTIGVTAPLGERLARTIRFRGAVRRGWIGGHCHRIVDGDRLLWAGSLATHLAPSSRSTLRLRGEILRTYPELAGVAVEHVWVAAGDYAVHQMPQIGELAPGLWLAAAFGHHDIAAATMAGNLIAQAIHGGDERWRLFQSYGLVWAGGSLGRAAMRAMLTASRVRTWWSGFIASRRLHASADHFPLPTESAQLGSPGAAAVEIASSDDPHQKRMRRPRKADANGSGAKPRRLRPKPAEVVNVKRVRQLPKRSVAKTGRKLRKPEPSTDTVAAPPTGEDRVG